VISGWLIKILVGIFLAGAIILELGSPVITRAQADDAAHEVADDASFAIRDTVNEQALKEACEQTAADKHVTIVKCEVDTNQDVVVTVEKKARSLILAKWSVTKDWYDIKVTATSTPKK
jgi:hypothetical protein